MKQASKTPGIDIAGSGSLGVFFAHLLRRRGHDIRWLTHRPTQVPRKISLEGLDIASEAGAPPSLQVLSYEGWTPIPGRILILASRADLTREFLIRIVNSGHPLPETWVACNGIGLLDGLPLERFPSGLSRLLCGFGMRELEPGRYVFSGPGSAEWADCLPGGLAPDPSRTWVLESLRDIGVQISKALSVKAAEWKKAAWNASMNAPLALAGLKNGALLESPELKTSFVRLLEETLRVSRAEGLELDPDGKLQERIEGSIRATAENFNSMASALSRGLPTEIDWINGAIVRMAERHGLEVPEQRRMLEAVRARSHPAR